jgi:hypothetical protein
MTDEGNGKRDIPAPDLLAALTAYGLRGPCDRAAATSRRPWGSWLAWLKRTFGHDAAGGAASWSNLDDEWAGGSYARSRRLLSEALRASR